MMMGINNISFSLDTPCTGFLSSSEVNFSGWEAKLDGKNVPIITSNLAFDAIDIPAGKHEIEFYYNPIIWVIGSIISIISLVLILIYSGYLRFLKEMIRTKRSQ